MSLFRSSNSFRLLIAAAAGGSILTLAGCGAGTLLAPNSTSTSASAISGMIHGGPNPVVGARVVIYATTSGGYGATATALQEASQQGTALHQDTDSNGNFTFAGGYTCPAGQYAYIVAYGGNTGANTSNANSVLMAALGPCSNLYSGTTFTGNSIFINELTTLAAGYALSGFTTVSGNSSTGFTVNVGAPATNNALTGSVTPGTPAVYATPGLRDAFQNAQNLVPYSGGTANATTANGAAVPTILINTLGNVLQACVNSTGGGTNASGAPTSSATAHDSTACGKLFAFTSYSTTAVTGPASGTSTTVTPTNTLSAVLSLAKRPTSNMTLWDPSCTTSGGSGTTTGVSCIYLLASPASFYQTTLSAAPPDYVMGISYPKGSFGGAAAANCGTGAAPIVFTTNSLYYPWAVTSDVDDNITILNEDNSSGTCFAVLTAKNDGTPIGGSQWVVESAATSATNARVIMDDQYGHAIVPSGALSTVSVFAAGPNDSLIASPTNVSDTSTPTFAGVDNSGNVYIGGQGSTSNLQLMSLTTASHAAPVYSIANLGSAAVTSKLSQITLDINGNMFSNSSSSSASSVYAFSPGATTFAIKSGIAGSTSNGVNVAPDSYGNNWTLVQNTTAPLSNIFYQTPYSGSGSTFALSSPVLAATITPTVAKTALAGQMDGNNVFWYSDASAGSTSTSPVTPGYVRAYDTVNNYAYPALYSCRVQTGQTLCGAQTSSNTPYLFYTTRGLVVDAAGSMWVVNGTQGQLNQVIGLAAPTLPLYVHNGTSMKP